MSKIADSLPGLVDELDLVSAFGGVLVLLYFIGALTGMWTTNDQIARVIVISAIISVFGPAGIKAIKKDL